MFFPQKVDIFFHDLTSRAHWKCLGSDGYPIPNRKILAAAGWSLVFGNKDLENTYGLWWLMIIVGWSQRSLVFEDLVLWSTGFWELKSSTHFFFEKVRVVSVTWPIFIAPWQLLRSVVILAALALRGWLQRSFCQSCRSCFRRSMGHGDEVMVDVPDFHLVKKKRGQIWFKINK